MGSRSRRPLGTEDRAQARRLALEAAATQPPAAGQRDPATPYTVSDALANWLTYAERSDREKSMVKRFRALYPNGPAIETKEANVADALASLSAGYANRIMSIVRAALRLAARQGRIPVAPTLTRRPTGPLTERVLQPREWQRLRDALPDYLVPPVEFSLATGLRRSNVLGLRWDQVDLPRAMAWIPAIRSKSRKAIPVPLSPAAVAILQAQVGQHPETVFTRPANPRAVKRRDEQPRVPIGDPKTAWRAARIAAGLTDFRWHDQRHTWASLHARSGTPMLTLQQLGGWAGPEMVARYAHLSAEHLAAHAGNAADAMGIRARASGKLSR